MARALMNDILKAFKIGANCVSFHQHRHFSFYDLEFKPGVKVGKLSQLSKEISLALKSKSLPIVKIIPERGLVRLQIIHKTPEILPFQNLVKTSSAKGFLSFVLGETDEGKPLWVDMSQNPHLLVAGATGSGKSIFLHTLISNALLQEDLELYLVDTKKVEFGKYQSLKYENSVFGLARDLTSAVNLLDHLLNIMEMRFAYLDSVGCCKIEQVPNMPKIMVIIDEVADLMLMDRDRVFENSLIKLAAKSRAAGIYLVLATQRPSADVLTGLIKANFPARLACKVSSKVDSQIILDQPGAEHLFGQGDALFKSPSTDLVRLQIAFPST